MGSDFLLIHRMAATFGRLDHETLELSEGLNILQAPNETGKSTWCAFLSAMLYGINSRERDRSGFLAEKNRYAPWTGAPMQGRIECEADGREITLLRETRRASSPMGTFRAVRTGTEDEVPELTAQTCGETLLGVPREVFERSAFIRQASLGITQDAELERRIASLITSGEEDTSYSEAAGVLRQQLNRRRHNRTGLLPQTEAELSELRRTQEELGGLQTQLAEAQGSIRRLAAQESELSEQLAQCGRYEAAQQRQAVRELQRRAEEAEASAAALRAQAEADLLPENETIGRLRGAIVNLETVRKSVDRARSERDEALKAVLRAEAAAGESPFAGQSAESARREAAVPPKAKARLGGPCLISAALLLLSGVAGYFFHKPAIAYCGFGLTVLVCWRLCVRARSRARLSALSKRFGTSDAPEIAALAETYVRLLDELEAARTNAAGKSAAYDSLYASLSSNEQGILLEVRRFAPAAADIPTADALLRNCAVRRRELTEAQAQAREARARCGPEETAPVSSDLEEPAPPAMGREALNDALAKTRAALASARSAADRLTGQIAGIGDPAELEARAEELERTKQTLEGEYQSIQMAAEALDAANAALQSRFSPELGRRSARLFADLTGEAYRGVALDRTFTHLSVEPVGDNVYRDAQLLSAGAADQLYLAVRLAICELVLPEEKRVPIVLDDALANFDDARCAAALRLLRREAEKRQILLFTCHTREAAFFRDDSAVAVRQLTGGVSGV